MISRFFIDRPIFATVLSFVITLIGFISLFYLPIAQYPRITPPAVVVSISYPGASAQVLAETVAAPVEQQVNGVQGMLYMSSQMGNDGTYSHVTLTSASSQKRRRHGAESSPWRCPSRRRRAKLESPSARRRPPLMMVNFYSARPLLRPDLPEQLRHHSRQDEFKC